PLALFVGTVMAGVLAVVAVAETHSWWVLAGAVAMVILLGLGFEIDIWNASPTDDVAPAEGSPDRDPDPEPAPASPDEPGPDYRGPGAARRVVVVTSEPLDADKVLAALTNSVSSAPDPAELGVMVVSPEGFGGAEITNDQGHYDVAQRAEAATVASLRRAGIKAAGHVGEHDMDQAIADALELFPAERVLVFADGALAAHA
ncbi:MAG: hypothetical protein QOJ12_132, partial [Thermoleophilales bacterium]|nr:hypothetical protein [Thermoleophilales bacterium]